MIIIRYIWYYTLRQIVRLTLYFYFRKIKVTGLEHIPKNVPIIFGANHENTFMDGLLIATQSSRFIHYLVRADVFKKTIARAALKSLNMLPVYRIRDGFGSLKSNDQSFSECYKALGKGYSLLLFPEGNHDIRRVRRTITKGISRIALGTMNSKTAPKELYVVPVGLNYSDHTAFRSSVHINFGTPIKVEQAEQNAKNLDQLRSNINDEIVRRCVSLNEEHYDLLDTLLFRSENGFTLNDPQDINTRAEKLVEKYKKSDSDGLDNAVREFDEVLDELNANNRCEVESTKTEIKLVEIIFSVPLYLIALVNSFIPALIIQLVIALKVKEEIFTTAIRYVLGLVLCPLIWYLQFLYFSSFGFSIWINYLYLISLPLQMLFMVYFHKNVRLYLAKRKFDKSPELQEKWRGSLEYIRRFKKEC